MEIFFIFHISSYPDLVAASVIDIDIRNMQIYNMQPKSDIWRLIWHFLTQNDIFFFVVHSELTGLLQDLFLTSLFFSFEDIQICM